MCFIYLCLCCLVLEHFFFSNALLVPIAVFIHGKTHGVCSASLQPWRFPLPSCHPVSFLRLEPNAETLLCALPSVSSEHINSLLESEILFLAASCRSHKPTFRNQQTRANGEQTSNSLVRELLSTLLSGGSLSDIAAHGHRPLRSCLQCIVFSQCNTMADT